MRIAFLHKKLTVLESLKHVPILLLWLVACSRQAVSPTQIAPLPSQQITSTWMPTPSPALPAFMTDTAVVPTPRATTAAPTNPTAAPSASPEPTAPEEPIPCQPLIEIPPGLAEWVPITLENVSRLEQWISLDLPGAEFRFSGNLAYLAVLMERQVQLYDIEQSRLIRCLPRDTTIAQYEFQFTFSDDESYFVWTALSNRIEFQEVTQAQALGSLPVAQGCCRWVNLSPDARHIAIIELWDSKQVLLWDLVADEVIPIEARYLVFSPDGRLAAVQTYSEQQRHRVSLWDLSTRQVIYAEKPAHQLEFSPDGTQLALAGWIDKPEVTVIDLSTFEQVHSLSGFRTAAPWFSVTFSPDRQTLLWHARSQIQLQDVATGLLGPSLSYQPMAFSPDSRLLAVAHAGYSENDQRGVIWLLDAQSGKEIFKFDLGDDLLARPLDFSPDSHMLATLDQDDNVIRFWSLNTGDELHTLSGSTEPISGFEFALCGRVLRVWMASGEVVLWAIPP